MDLDEKKDIRYNNKKDTKHIKTYLDTQNMILLSEWYPTSNI